MQSNQLHYGSLMKDYVKSMISAIVIYLSEKPPYDYAKLQSCLEGQKLANAKNTFDNKDYMRLMEKFL